MLKTIVFSCILVTVALLAVLLAWFVSGKKKVLEKRCGKKPDEESIPSPNSGGDSCHPGGCEMCSNRNKKASSTHEDLE